MNKLTVILAGMLFVTSCSQLTTNKSELAGLKNVADNFADVYVDCVVKNSLTKGSKNVIDVAAVVSLAENLCQTELNQFKASQKKYLQAQVMRTEKPLNESVMALNQRATMESGEALIAAAENQTLVAAPAAAGTTVTAATVATAAATPSAAPAGTGWSAEQRIYLDCMDDQAKKYAGVNESASVIADVAQSRCKSYMTGPGAAVLEQEGRTLVMGAVLDAKLQGSGRQPNN